LNGVFTSEYDNYMVVIRLTVASASGDNISFRLRASGTDNSTASSYVSQYLYAGSTTVIGARQTLSYGQLTYAYAGTEMGFSTNLYGPYLTQPTAFRTVAVSNDASALVYDYAGTHNQSTAYDGITIGNIGGSRTISGLVSVYGLGG